MEHGFSVKITANIRRFVEWYRNRKEEEKAMKLARPFLVFIIILALFPACRSRDTGDSYLDVLAAFRARVPTGPDSAYQLFIDQTHPTDLGHQIAAAALAELLEESGLIARIALQAGGQ